MNQEEKKAILALKDFMASIGASPEEIEKEFEAAFKKDPNMTDVKAREVRNLLGFGEPKKVSLGKMNSCGVKPGVVNAVYKKPPKLHEPVKHPLEDLLKELKFGRSVEDQQLLDRLITETLKEENIKKAKKRITQKIDLIFTDFTQIPDSDPNKDWMIDQLEEIKDVLNE